jgi:hypothetical protein
VHDHRSRVSTRSDSISDHLVVESQLGYISGVGSRLESLGDQRPISHSDCWQIEVRAELQRQTRAAGVITTGRIHEQDLRLHVQFADRLDEQSSFTQRQ